MNTRANPMRLIAALCLALALAGCGGGQTLEVTPEQWCAQSAYVDLVNTGASEQRYAGWDLVDSAGRYNLPDFQLAPGAALRVWRGAGKGDAQNLYLAQPEPSWDYAHEAVSVEGGLWLFQEPRPVFTTIHCDPAP
ncbi:MAG: lamin tail domain-containing protein [Chloroflexales bacterium]|nr:lamin tail domain-containing protein [Chloroflexales bacterium]